MGAAGRESWRLTRRGSTTNAICSTTEAPVVALGRACSPSLFPYRHACSVCRSPVPSAAVTCAGATARWRAQVCGGGLGYRGRVASWSIRHTCVVLAGVECTPPLTLPPPPSFIRLAPFASTTCRIVSTIFPSEPLMRVQAQRRYRATMPR
jgi:hypothetical protein